KGPGSEQVREAGFPVIDLGPRLDETSGPFRDTAAVLRNLDLLVVSDTSVAHLAGALTVRASLAPSPLGDSPLRPAPERTPRDPADAARPAGALRRVGRAVRAPGRGAGAAGRGQGGEAGPDPGGGLGRRAARQDHDPADQERAHRRRG